MKNNLLFLLLFWGIIGCSDDDMSGSIYGTVFTEDGSAPVNATVSLYKLERYHQNGSEHEYGRWIVDQQKKTDDNGYYEFVNLSPVESYQLKAELKGYAICSSSFLLKSERMNIDVPLEKVKVDTSDGIIVKEAGIVVQKLDVSAGQITQELAEQLCAASIVGGHKDWRLPTIGELSSMYNNKSLLTGIKAGNYWSSSSLSSGGYFYYVLSMGNGNITDIHYSNGAYARCVRSIEKQ